MQCKNTLISSAATNGSVHNLQNRISCDSSTLVFKIQGMQESKCSTTLKSASLIAVNVCDVHVSPLSCETEGDVDGLQSSWRTICTSFCCSLFMPSEAGQVLRKSQTSLRKVVGMCTELKFRNTVLLALQPGNCIPLLYEIN